ncbi:DUF551 domain-containing protein [Enterobacter asburiae]|uniref:DUF551 domain-containing protein n=1 Tax=Enterobacter asburiae TaxID=61645 RepID=UPI002FFB8B20
MSTITRERAELKSFITGFLSDPAHDNQSSRSMTAEVFRIALASLEAEPDLPDNTHAKALRDEMPFSFDIEQLQAAIDSGFVFMPDYIRYDCGCCGWETIEDWRDNDVCPKCNHGPMSKTELYTAPPVPVVPDIDTIALNTARNIMCDINRMEGWPGGEVQLLACIQGRIEQTCRTAMLQAGNSLVIQDGWISCSEQIPKPSIDVIVACEFFAPGDWRKKVGHIQAHCGEWYVYGASWIPTHWMPLPAPPQGVK